MTKKKVVPNRWYPLEVKLEATRLAETVGSAEAARRMSIPEQNIYKWRKLKAEGKLVSGGGNVTAIKLGSNEVHAENERLRRELANAKMDLEILKNATAYFARQFK